MTSEIEYKCNNCGHEGLNTRAVPDVPELVRYRIWFDNNYNEIVDEDPEGEYVRYHQAAKVVAKLTKDANHQCRERDKEFERSEAAEAELAKIKAQEPVGYFVKTGNDYYQEIDGDDEGIPLYAAPVDQTEEIERLREALHNLTEACSFEVESVFKGEIGDEMDAARAALS